MIETHVHADFLSGHLELAEAVGARICFGPAADVEFPVERLDDGQRVLRGDVEVLHTPGHTPESICIVARASRRNRENRPTLDEAGVVPPPTSGAPMRSAAAARWPARRWEAGDRPRR